MGTLLGVRPLIHINEEGQMLSIGKERGRANAIDALLRYADELGDDVAGHRIIIAHTGALEIVEQVEEMVREKYGKDVEIVKFPVNPTAGAHCGPDSVGLCFHSKRR